MPYKDPAKRAEYMRQYVYEAYWTSAERREYDKARKREWRLKRLDKEALKSRRWRAKEKAARSESDCCAGVVTLVIEGDSHWFRCEKCGKKAGAVRKRLKPPF